MNNIEIDFGNAGFKINAELKLDGNMWCVGIGPNLQEGIYAFDNYPAYAIEKFKHEFINYTPSKDTPKKAEIPQFEGTTEALAKLGTIFTKKIDKQEQP